MSRKADDLIGSYLKGAMGRRELIRRVGAAGVTAAAANLMLTRATGRAWAQEFDWKAHQGTPVRLLLNKHPYADAMIANIEAFKELTGMDVAYDIFPEDVYFDKVTSALSSGSDQYDAFMTGAYQTWTYGPAGWIADLNEYIQDPAYTSPSYNWEGVLPNLRASTAWSGVPGAELGGEDAKQWAVPWGFELNSVSYNRRIFDQLKMEPPTNLPDMMEKAARIQKDAGGPYGVGVRGSRSWATIHPGYLSGFTSYGAKDFAVQDGKIIASMNSPEGKAFTRQWVQMIKDSGPRSWSSYTWYEVGNDLGAGQSGMIFDADILGYFQNSETQEAGNIAYTAFAANPEAPAPTPNVWIWSLAMNANSAQPEAAWYFMQWASGQEHGLFGAVRQDMVNPVRQAIWDDPDFQKRISDSYPGYLDQFQKSSPGAKIYFTAQPLFSDLTTEWAVALQRMVANEVPVDEGLDQLAESTNAQLQQAGVQ